jgi:hypothetical protein
LTENPLAVDGLVVSSGERCRTALRALPRSATHTPPDTTVDWLLRNPPVDALAQVSRGQSAGSPAPEPGEARPVVDLQDLWDRLGDFA